MGKEYQTTDWAGAKAHTLPCFADLAYVLFQYTEKLAHGMQPGILLQEWSLRGTGKGEQRVVKKEEGCCKWVRNRRQHYQTAGDMQGPVG